MNYKICTLHLLYFILIFLIYYIIFFLLQSILKMKKFKEVTIKEIEKPIKSWMVQAPTRIKKKFRKKCLK